MIAPALLNVVKTSLKSLYDIDPLVVDHMVLSVKLQAQVVSSRSAQMLQEAQRAVRSSFSIQPLSPIA